MLAYTLIALTCEILGYDGTWKARDRYIGLLLDTKYTFFLAGYNSTSETDNLDVTTNNLEVALVLLKVMIVASCRVQNLFILHGFGISCITIWAATKSFETEIHMLDRSNLNALQIKDKFHDLMKLADSVNAVWNHFCFWVVVDSVLNFSVEFDKLFRTEGGVGVLYLCNYLAYTGSYLFLSAECHKKVISIVPK